MPEKSETARLEAFCDGVFAIAITILILEIKVPAIDSIHSTPEFWRRTIENWPSWFGFLLSFCMILISWINHHGTFKYVERVSIQFIYANGFLLLTIVVIPYATALVAQYLETPYGRSAINIYCLTVLFHNISWNLVAWTLEHPVLLIKNQAVMKRSLRLALKNSQRGFVLYLFIFILSFWLPVTAIILNALSWISWIILGFVLANSEEEHK